MFDSHCHLHDRRMTALREAAVLRARAVGVAGVLLAGVDAPGWQDAAAVHARYGEQLIVALAYGVHPQAVAEAQAGADPAAWLDEQLAALEAAARGLPMTVGATPLPRPHAIGELGLDRPRDRQAEASSLLLQQRAFRSQLDLARQLDLPLVLHVLRTHADVLRILKTDGVPRAGGVVHSYSGAAELVAEYVKLGLHISFAGPVTYPEARRVHAAVRAVPDKWLLAETDAPDQTPRGRRPSPCEPAFLIDIIEALGHLRQQSREDVARTTDENARRLFAI